MLKLIRPDHLNAWWNLRFYLRLSMSANFVQCTSSVKHQLHSGEGFVHAGVSSSVKVAVPLAKNTFITKRCLYCKKLCGSVFFEVYENVPACLPLTSRKLLLM